MFSKEDLKYAKYYDWSTTNLFEEHAPKFNDQFTKYDGHHTLALINLFATKYQLVNRSDCHMLEDAIGVCPTKFNKIQEIFAWLELDKEQAEKTYGHNKEDDWVI